MDKRITNYRRFYAAFNRLAGSHDDEEMKGILVRQYSNGRTGELRELTVKEYVTLCEALESQNGSRDELKRQRSIALKLMQGLKVDTTDWAQINDFCRHPKIAGHEFGRLNVMELKALSRKLRNIQRKGWQRKAPDETAGGPEQLPKEMRTYYLPIGPQVGKS